jgi:hypothetical protein
MLASSAAVAMAARGEALAILATGEEEEWRYSFLYYICC